MARAKKDERWSVEDLADFEALFVGGEIEKGARRLFQDKVAPCLSGQSLDEEERRRRGLRLWLEEKRGRDELVAGRRLEAGLHWAGLLVTAIAFLAGVGVARGLLFQIPGEGARGYNIWIFLGVCLGSQWLLLLFGFLAWLLYRKTGRLTWLQELIGLVTRKLGGKKMQGIWDPLLRLRSDGYGSILGWRLGLMSQQGAAAFGLGLLLSFLGCLFFLKVQFYWESTFTSLSAQQLTSLTHMLSSPWQGLGSNWVPGEVGVDATSLLQANQEGLSVAQRGGAFNETWLRFMSLALLVWGVFPRLVLMLVFKLKEGRALSKLSFQETRHRQFWREIARTERGGVSTSQADGVIVIEGLGTSPERPSLDALRPFLLQKIRGNPIGALSWSDLKRGRTEKVEEALSKARRGVVWVVWKVEGAEAIFKERYAELRALIGEEVSLWLVVVGSVKNDSLDEAPAGEVAKICTLGASLKDGACEVVGWEPSVGGGLKGGRITKQQESVVKGLGGLLPEVKKQEIPLKENVAEIQLPEKVIPKTEVRPKEKAVKPATLEPKHESREEVTVAVEPAKKEVPAGVVLVDVGGAGLPVSILSPFLTRELLGNPTRAFQMGVLDSEKERQAEEALKKSEGGAILAVEGWNLSGPEMKTLYQKVRGLIGEKAMVHVLVVGTVKGNGITEVKDGEMLEWEKFVDGLRDPALEVLRWQA